jgi:hypothetical protein
MLPPLREQRAKRAVAVAGARDLDVGFNATRGHREQTIELVRDGAGTARSASGRAVRFRAGIGSPVRVHFG